MGTPEISSDQCAKETAELRWMLSAPIGIYIIQDGRFKLTNPGFEKATGYSREELLEIDPWSIVAPDYRETVRENAVKMLKGDRSAPYEFQAVSKDGQMKWIVEVVTPILYGGKRATLGYFMNMTEQKEIQDALRRSEQEYRELFFYAPIGIVQTSLDGRPLNINPELVRILGYGSPEEFISQVPDMTQLVYADPGQRTDLINLLLKGENSGVSGFECCYSKKNGDIITVNLHARIVRDHTGGIHKLEAFIEDVSERRRLEDLLRKAKENLENQVEERTAELKRKAKHLEEANTALKVLLNRSELDRRELEETVLSNIKSLIEPSLEMLRKSRWSPDEKRYLDLMESHIKGITSPFVKNLSQVCMNLTRTEMRIASLIRDGRTTREIAKLLRLSQYAVIFHRRNIRRKLCIKGKKINLITYLQSFDR